MAKREKGRMSALDAAFTVLEKAERPLTAREITGRMLDEGLWRTSGKTPEATVQARLAVEIKRRGSESRFRRVRPGLYSLNR